MTERRLSNAPTRREFCAQACQFASAAALGGVLSGCGASPTAPNGPGAALPTIDATLIDGSPALAIDAGSPLASIGRPALVQSPAGSFLVTRTNQDTFVALASQCTHYICTVKNFSGSVYVCPCHGSQFDVTGEVVRGPATKPLQRYDTHFSGGTLRISA
jgi:Rieske Fe-S protein